MTRRLKVLSSQDDFKKRVQNKRERVHILTGTICNNNCTFCMEEDREGRKVTNARTDDDLVEWILKEHPDCEEVCFTSGEPTTNKRFPYWVKMAKAAGVPQISVMTNGRALAYAKYTRGLVKAGLNRFYISIHGHTKKLHQSLVRTPGAFEQTVDGIREVAALAPYGVQLHTSTVITKGNLPYLTEIYEFLRGLGVQQVVFNVMQANGRANTHFDMLFPRYTEIAAAFKAFVDGQNERSEAFLVDIPPCTTTNIPDYNRGFVEAYRHYEDKGQTNLEAREEDVDDLVSVTRENLDDALREKRAECRSCDYTRACEGVWVNYLKRYGWDEMQPVQNGSEPTSAEANKPARAAG